MSISSSEIKWRKPAEISDVGTNGGRMVFQEIISGVQEGVFANVSEAERTSGSEVWRKVFIQIDNAANLEFIDPKIFVESVTPGEDNLVFIVGDQNNTETQLTGTEQKYGAGTLSASVTAGGFIINVDVEDAALDIFKNGMKIRISEKTDVYTAGNQEFNIIDSAASYVGNNIELTLDNALANNYSNLTPTKVASTLEPGTIESIVQNFSVSSGSGTYNDTSYPIELFNKGTIEQDWVATFTSASDYNLVGDIAGAVGSGNTASNFSPTNPETGASYLTILSAGFGGTFVSSDTISFTTSPCAVGLWYNRNVPVGAASISGNGAHVGISGESA